MDLDDAIAELSKRLAHYPPARYPVQHATTQFHLGQALLQGGQTQPAITALRTSMQWFPEAMAVERAKVLNLLGAALRSEGHLQMAAAAFTAAGTVFAEHDLTAEHGAVLFNLGLVQRDSSDSAAAAVSFAAAQEQFAGGPPAPQAAAATHRGKALLEAGRIDDAAGALAQAVELAQRAGDREGVGVASNALGLALHAAGRPREAVTALRLAVASHPNSVRPAEFAMAKANLALAYEALGLPAHARMAAHQALAAAPPAPVHEQAASLLNRLGPSAGSDLLVVLDDEPTESWPTTVREELVRWAALPADERRAEARTWIDGLAQRPEHSDSLVHVWLSALIELPPSDLDGLVRAVLEAARNVDLDEWRVVWSKLDRAMAWFPVPQMMRLRDRFEQTDGEPGEEEPCNPPPDLTTDAIAAALPGRAVRSYPAMLATEPDALAWARAGGPAGALVVADYQASPRGRGGWEWHVTPGRGLGFSLLLRPALPPAREGWPYLPVCTALADVVGPTAAVHWPDEVHQDGLRAAAVGVHIELGPDRIEWATVTVLVDGAEPPRTDLLARVVAAIEYRMDDDSDTVLRDYRARCATLGKEVTAHLVPMGPAGVRVTGEAADCRADGSLVIVQADDRRVRVPPQHLGVLDVEY